MLFLIDTFLKNDHKLARKWLASENTNSVLNNKEEDHQKINMGSQNIHKKSWFHLISSHSAIASKEVKI